MSRRDNGWRGKDVSNHSEILGGEGGIVDLLVQFLRRLQRRLIMRSAGVWGFNISWYSVKENIPALIPMLRVVYGRFGVCGQSAVVPRTGEAVMADGRRGHVLEMGDVGGGIAEEMLG